MVTGDSFHKPRSDNIESGDKLVQLWKMDTVDR